MLDPKSLLQLLVKIITLWMERNLLVLWVLCLITNGEEKKDLKQLVMANKQVKYMRTNKDKG
jgi:hypothetical protein